MRSNLPGPRTVRLCVREPVSALLLQRRNQNITGSRQHGPAMDLPPPCTGLECAGLNKLFKALQISVDSALDHAELIADVLHDTFGVVIQFQRNASSVVTERREIHHARIFRAGGAPPGDALVGNLLENFGVPLLSFAANFSDPMQALIVELLDFRDAFHEPGKLLELRPLIVNLLNRRIDFNALFNTLHSKISLIDKFFRLLNYLKQTIPIALRLYGV